MDSVGSWTHATLKSFPSISSYMYVGTGTCFVATVHWTHDLYSLNSHSQWVSTPGASNEDNTPIVTL